MDRLLLGIIAAALLPACAGGPQDPGICNQPFIPALSMVYPKPGATNVPDSLSTIVFSGQPNTGGGVPSIELSIGDQRVTSIGTFGAAPSPLPSPAATPVPGQPPSYVAVTVNSLSPHTTYDVTYQYTFPGSGQCAGTVNMAEGSFTTQ
jgi:hypothetical protein